MAPTPWRPKSAEEDRTSSVTVEMLYRELSGENSSVTQPESPELLLEAVSDALFPDSAVDLDESVVKGNLDAVLLALVATQDRNTHGKGLMETLSTSFGADFSPGTVYPCLHDLEDEGCLETRELVRTKEYAIHDDEMSQERIEAAAQQHLALGAFLKRVSDNI
ncbi:PadR family transcriptional regulator [Salinirubellus sp. GCM10025818]|uniref:PadR family transcriptional regulator n=1 Tax=Salinirubellus TaxID=2162630 RepID=UPI0030CFAB12